ncbi:hypothetical protein E3N88_09081 [Mikania micrantha]|uniref:Uncharacterized protein n=1 Tax=Mikania micrantha TaxID=192012 RepID=A0A5N6PL54_9ASTR|nr:hypothetical protein E3N88_09081 [Mikania micrantha]
MGGISPEDEDELVDKGMVADIFLGLAPDQTQCVWVLCVTTGTCGEVGGHGWVSLELRWETAASAKGG